MFEASDRCAEFDSQLAALLHIPVVVESALAAFSFRYSVTNIKHMPLISLPQRGKIKVVTGLAREGRKIPKPRLGLGTTPVTIRDTFAVAGGSLQNHQTHRVCAIWPQS